MLTVNTITKTFGHVTANDNISFTVEHGEVFGLLGPNGSGKTTLISQMIGFMKPDEGNITIANIDVIEKPDQARKLCSLQPQENISLSGLTPRQAIELTGRFRKGDRSFIRKRTNQLLHELQIEKWADEASENLSGVVRRLVTFCMAIIVPGKLVILDEPTNDVDPIRRKLLWDQVRQLADDGVTVLLITHNVLEAEKSVDRLALIHEGKIIGFGTPAQLKASFKGKLRLELAITKENDAISLPDYATLVQRTKHKIALSIPKDHSQAVIEWVNQLQLSGKIDEFSLSPATLEDTYLKMIEDKEHKSGGGNEHVVLKQ